MKYDCMKKNKCSDRWKTKWCVSVVKSFPNPLWKPLIATVCLLVVIVHGLADRLRNFVVGIFVPQYHYPYAVAFCFAEVLISRLFLNLLYVLGLVPLGRNSRELGERLLLPAICNSVQAVLSMWAKANSLYTSLFHFTVPLLPLVTVVFSFSLKLPSQPSYHSSFLISILSGVFVVFTAPMAAAATEPLEYVYAPLALILHSISLTCLAKVSQVKQHNPSETQTSVFDIYYTQLVNQSWVLGLLWLLHPDNPWQVLRHSSWQNLLFHGYLLAILLLGMVLNFMVCMSALCVSPVAAALIHSARVMVQPFITWSLKAL